MRLIKLVIFLFFIDTSAHAQDQSLRPTFNAIIVSDIDSSISWYAGVLKLRVRNRVDNNERGFKQAILFNADCMIELVQLKRSISQDSLLSGYPKGTRIMGITKFGFTVTDIDSMHQTLASKHVRFFGSMVKDPVSNKRTFLVTDPDGNLVQFFEQ